jgi:putative salt-induced outer membrane protein YdiY
VSLGLVWASASALADEVRLNSGDLLIGTIVEQRADGVVLSHSLLGALTIPAGEIAAVTPAAAEPTPVPVEEPPVATPRWDSRFEAGFSASDGNSETVDARVGVESVRETEKYRLKLDSSYFVGTTSGDRTRNEFTAGALSDFFIPDEDWFYFLSGRYSNNQFRAYENLLEGNAGLGYQLAKTEAFEANARAGLGVAYEFGGDAEGLRPEGLAGAEMAWNLTKAQTVTAGAVLYQYLSEWGRYRVVSKGDWRVKIDRADGVSLKLGYENKYESWTKDDSEHNDFLSYGALVVEF